MAQDNTVEQNLNQATLQQAQGAVDDPKATGSPTAAEGVPESTAGDLKQEVEEKSKGKKVAKEIPNITEGVGINLIPTLSADEAKKETRSVRLNLASAFGILFIVIVTIIIYGVNIFTRIQLNREKERINSLEEQLLSHSEIISKNNQIIDRFNVYRDIQETTFSPKEVMLYWRDLTTGFGEVEAIELSNGLSFEVQGGSRNLQDVAALWHLLTVDAKVSQSNLESLSKSIDGATYKFEGKLDFDYFVNAQDSVQEVDPVAAPPTGEN